MKDIHKAVQFVVKNFTGEVEVVCAWPRASNFPGIWVLAKCLNTKYSSYNVYVCKRGFWGYKLTKIIPIWGPTSKEQVITLTDGNEVTWISENLLEF